MRYTGALLCWNVGAPDLFTIHERTRARHGARVRRVEHVLSPLPPFAYFKVWLCPGSPRPRIIIRAHSLTGHCSHTFGHRITLGLCGSEAPAATNAALQLDDESSNQNRRRRRERWHGQLPSARATSVGDLPTSSVTVARSSWSPELSSKFRIVRRHSLYTVYPACTYGGILGTCAGVGPWASRAAPTARASARTTRARARRTRRR